MNVDAYFDGGARGAPGPAACGALIKVEGRHMLSQVVDIGISTNNVAEWRGLILALDIAEHGELLHPGDRLAVFSDSKLVVEQALGRWQVKADHLVPLRDNAIKRATRMRFQGIMLTIQHVPREENSGVDRIVTDFLDEITGKKRQN